MATASNATHLPPLGTHVREDVGNHLQDTLVELIDLSLLGKQLHWSVVGPHFKPVHEQLDELIDSWREMADTVAERAVAIGYMPDGQAQARCKHGEGSSRSHQSSLNGLVLPVHATIRPGRGMLPDDSTYSHRGVSHRP